MSPAVVGPPAPDAPRARAYPDLVEPRTRPTRNGLVEGRHQLVLRLEDFEVTNGPDLFVLVTPAGEVPDHDVLDEAGWVELGALRGNIGSQNYVLPGDLSPEDLGSVVIWCRAFRVIFSVAELSPAMG